MGPGVHTASALLPPVGKGRRYERKALQIRQFAGVRINERLDPYLLARYARLQVVSLDDIRDLSPEVRTQLLEADPESWSGGASKPLPDGSRVIVLKPTHGRERQAATLMEEVCHVFLGHDLNRVGLPISGDEGHSRDYNYLEEEEAYAVGAAVLVPYYVLRKAIETKLPIEELA